MQNIYLFVQKYLLWLIILAIGAGLVFTRLTGGYEFNSAICLLAALAMIYPSLVPLDFEKIKEIGKHKKLIFLSLIVNFVIFPLLAVLIGRLFLLGEPNLWLGLILLSILPGGGMVTTWAYKSKANLPLTVGIVFANLLAAVVLVPFYLSLAINKLASVPKTILNPNQSCILEPVTNGTVSCFFSGDGGVSPLKIAIPILVIIVLPLILAYFTQKYFTKRYQLEEIKLIKQKFAALSNIGLLLVLLILMGIKQNAIIFERPDLIAKAIGPLIIFYLISFLISYMLFRFKKGAEGRAILWGTYLRYITLALGLAISLIYQNPDYSLAAVVILLAYLIQIPSSFWLANKLNKQINI